MVDNMELHMHQRLQGNCNQLGLFSGAGSVCASR